MLEINELENIFDNIKQRIYTLNANNELESILDKFGIEYSKK